MSRDKNRGSKIQPFLSGQIDALYEIASSAGRQSGVLSSRMYYLVRSGNYPTHRAETDASLAFLRKNASKIPDTWKMDALYAALQGDQRQLVAAREGAEKSGIPKEQVDQVRWLERIAQDGWAAIASEQKVMRFEPGLPAAAKGLVRRLDPQN